MSKGRAKALKTLVMALLPGLKAWATKQKGLKQAIAYPGAFNGEPRIVNEEGAATVSVGSPFGNLGFRFFIPHFFPAAHFCCPAGTRNEDRRSPRVIERLLF